MAVGTTFDQTITRDALIKRAYKDIGALSDDQTLTGIQQQDGEQLLGMIVRELSDDELYIHCKITQSLTLAANVFAYTTSNGLPSSMVELLAVSFRDQSGNDHPVDILTRERYEAIPNKIYNGDPQAVFLTDELSIGSRTLYAWPAPNTVNTQSVVTGTDASPYKCLRTHLAESVNRPITGANWRLYWEAGGSGPSVWAADTTYTAPEQLRLTYARPLYDFDGAAHNPDIPQSQALFLCYLLCARLAPSHGKYDQIPMWEGLADKAFTKVFRRTMVKQSSRPVNRASRYY